MGGSDADWTLCQQALSGDRGAIRRLSARLLDAVHREVAQCLLRWAPAARRDARQEVADLVQEVLVALYERDSQELRRWDPKRGRSLDSFVRLLARRRVARIFGQLRGNPWAEAPLDPADVELDDDAGHVRRLEERGELDAVLMGLNARMSVRDQELFDLLYVQELDPDEVARQMDMSRGAVHAWSYRTRKLARSIVALSPPIAPVTEEGTSKSATRCSIP
jgi:RNA polymerase sigma factor (sigma-70 family)